MQDVLNRKSVALPASSAAATTAAIDLEGGGAHIAGKGWLVVRIPATPALADTKTITVSLTDCATLGGSYTAITGYGAMVVTGATATPGGAATEFKLAIHPHVKRFVKATFTIPATSGDNTAVAATVGVEIP